MIKLDQLNSRMGDSNTSVMNFLNEIASRYPNAISFAPGRPPESNFNVEESLAYVNVFLEYTKKTADPSYGDYPALGQYGKTKGMISDVIAKLLKNDESIDVDPKNIVVTVGCQEAMCLCLVALATNTKNVVLVEDPTYVGIVGAANLLGCEIIGVPTDENGVNVEKLRSIVTEQKRQDRSPALLYTSPDFSNPTGATASHSQRERLLNLTRDEGIIILEDHAYNYFCYDDNKRRCLKSMNGSEHVIYLGSFSKSIYPGLRIGFLVAGQKVDLGNKMYSELSDEISKVKSFLTVNSSPLNQAIAGGLIVAQNFSLVSYTKPIRDRLRDNRDSMIKALHANFPRDEAWCNGVSWNSPEGGFFIALKVPFYVADEELYSCVEQYGVIWTPMKYFCLTETVSDRIRLSFSYVDEAQIYQGVESLAKFVRYQIERIER